MPGARGFHSIEGVASDGGTPRTFLIAQSKIELLQRSGPTQKFWDLALLPDVLKSPDVIFEGLKRDDLSDSFCYSKFPSRRLKDSTIEIPFDPRFAFLVLVNHDHRGYIVMDWEIRRSDPNHAGHPFHWETDFERRKWVKP